jgi:hypothetical protein
VGGSKSSPLRRAVAIVIVFTIHAVGLLLLVEFRTKNSAPGANDFTSTLILLPANPPPTAPADKRQSPLVNMSIQPVPLNLPTLESVESPPDTPGPVVDWAAEAQREGTAITDPPKARVFGRIIHPDAEGKALPSTPAHHAGEQYRDPFGQSIVWVSGRCYLVSESAPLGMPQGSIPTKTICAGDSGESRGDLFKDLSAYKKRHPQ